MANEKLGFTHRLDNFNELLQKGFFSELYQKERALEKEVAGYHYKLATLQRFSEKPPEGGNQKQFSSDLLVGCNKVSDDCFSVQTLEISGEDEGPVDDDDFGGPNMHGASHQQGQAGNGGNTVGGEPLNFLGKRDPASKGLDGGSGRGENRTKESKGVKNINVVTVKPSTPEWITNFRGQEKERYKSPTTPWSYTLEDGTRYIHFT